MISSKYLIFIYSIVLIILTGCDSSNQKKNNSKSPRIKSHSKIESPRNGSNYTIGDTIEFKVSLDDNSLLIDSIRLSHNGLIVSNNANQWETKKETPGKKSLLISVHLSNGTVEKKRHSVTLLSEIEPNRYTYRITNTFVHDPDAFTEGLLINNNELYESTGNKGESSIRKVNMSTGEVIKSVDISAQYFGEGIGVIEDKLYMLSWKQGTGFIFNKSTLKQIGQFSYPTEGWGMTSNADTLIMSDGTNVLRFMEPESFSEYRQIEVYDKNGPIDFLNELEYVNGDIFAVRWQTEMIYIVDPLSGKVKGILDLTGIFDYSKYERRIDVLNGIAYNSQSGKYYVTGKWWPKLFEIQLIAANNI
ncbi:MAG: glutaminyl-peptide cyclotransferase [Reichenbachiella sp.]|uniref:glutaminyl-peptide cyclotransferase n=1 Tax=Reichenbachiella sp. TaxID=2184521 RepID=UPI003263ED74